MMKIAILTTLAAGWLASSAPSGLASEASISIQSSVPAPVSCGGVVSHTFRGQGRCSQVTGKIRSICSAMGGSPGEVWCDERGHVTEAHVICPCK